MFLEDLAILADIVGDIVTLPVKVAHWSVELGNDITETVAQARQQDALLHQMEKSAEDGDFEKMLEIKTLLGQWKE